MPQFTPIETLDDGCVLGTSISRNNRTWYVRMYWRTGKSAVYKSTKIAYEDSVASKRNAKREANKLWSAFLAKVEKGDSPTSVRTVKNVADSYNRHIRELAQKNAEAKKPIHLIRGGRGESYWTHEKVDAVENILRHLESFWKTLNEGKEFRQITERDLDRFFEWSREWKDWSPSWTNRVITQIRMIWHFGRDKGWTDLKPSPTRPKENIAERARRNLKEEEWRAMMNYARDRATSARAEFRVGAVNKDSALQFWMWLNFISWTGIRPPTTRNNALRWSDIRTTEKGGRIITRTVKATKEQAAILPQCFPYLDFLKEFQSRRGLEDCEFMFAHTTTKRDTWDKGEPILGFKKQWETMLKELDLWLPWGTPANEKLVPYSMRGFHVTMSIRNGVDVRKLAKSLGTSPKMIDQTYDDFQTDAEIEELTKRSGIANIGEVKWDKNNYPLLRG